MDVRTCKIQKNTAEVKNACGSVRLTTLPCGSVRVRTQGYGVTICRVTGAIIGAVCLTSLHRS